MDFSWDPRKETVNKQKHGISFKQAMTAFDDPYALIAPDSKHSTGAEIREWLIGESDMGVIVVVYTKRVKGQVCRIISARRANRQERGLYEEYKRIPV